MGNRTYLFLEDSVSHDEMCLGEKMIVPCDSGYCRMVGAYGQARGWPGYHAVGLPLTRGPARTNDFVAAALLGITAARQAARARGDLPKLVVVRDLTPICSWCAALPLTVRRVTCGGAALMALVEALACGFLASMA